MRNAVILMALLAAALGGAIWLDVSSRPDVTIVESAGETLNAQPAPDIQMTDLNGQQHRFSDWRGKAVIMNFWASWCAPCVVEMPDLLAIARDNPDDVVLLLVSVDSEENAILPFFAKHGFKRTDNVIIVHDIGKAISQNTFGTIRYPETILIDKTGNMVKKIAGAIDWTAPAGLDLLDPLLK